MFAFADPTELWLPVPPLSQSAAYSNSASRWNAYINQVCLEAVLAWIRAEHAPDAVPWTGDQPPFWETINGAAIQIGNLRLALIPTEAIDDEELSVPQEWIDIPDWAADYYLAVQAQLEPSEENWIRVWGYATHQALKTGYYDPDDRTYGLAAEQLTQDWSALWVTLRFCPDAQTRAMISPLPELPAIQAENLIQRLSNSELAFPRLTVPFELWGALMQNPTWRQQLYQRRTQSVSVNLRQWLQQQATGGWQRLENLLASEARLAVNLRGTDNSGVDADATQGKLIEVAGQTVALVVYLNQEVDGRVAILVQLHPTAAPMPANLSLSLLAETGEILQTVQAGTQDSYIQLRRFRCPEGTRFAVQVELAPDRVIESFVV